MSRKEEKGFGFRESSEARCLRYFQGCKRKMMEEDKTFRSEIVYRIDSSWDLRREIEVQRTGLWRP
jgi:hypothetical protein